MRSLNRIIYFFNGIAAFLMLVSFGLPYIPPTKFPAISVLSLGVPVLIIINLIFLAYWTLQFNRRLILSLVVLVFSYFYFNVFYEFSSEGNPDEYENTLTILSYNVRLFNAYEKENHGDVPEMMRELLQQENPDIVCIQEYYKPNQVDFSEFPYQYIHFRGKNTKLGHAIFSKYPLINKNAFDFPDSNNNIVYADVVKGKDTLRIYNMHMQSLGVEPEIEFLQQENTEELARKISQRFRLQETQVRLFLDHKSKTDFPVILCGDMNNTPFSYTYRKLNNGMQDSFRERGKGLGTTFSFDGFPIRIDYIFASPELEVISFRTFKKTFSDHRPIRSVIGW